jgi:hypothetical protein
LDLFITVVGHATARPKLDFDDVLLRGRITPLLGRLPVHPVQKMQKLVLLGRQGGRADRAESKESPVFMRIFGYLL